ncbi:MAG TPA: response regulator, partial [Gammaproteobacteria bacterium]|nr:response regulator [Gammaproteobacteria bacterium]
MAIMDERVLIIEGDPVTAKLIRDALSDARYGPFIIEWVATFSEGIERLNKGGLNAVLLNLFLSDSQGIETFDKLYGIACQIPILILSDADQEGVAQQAIQHGAQDYFLKNHIDGYTLSHALRNVVARKVAEEALFIERERAQVTLNSIGDAVISADVSGNVTYLNMVAERMTGWSREEAAGRAFADVLQIIDGATRKPARSPIALAVQRNKAVGLSANCILIRRDGFELPIEDSAVTGNPPAYFPLCERGGEW